MQVSSLITESECKQYIAGPLEDDTCKGSPCMSEDYRKSGKYSENKKCEGMLNGAGDKALTVAYHLPSNPITFILFFLSPLLFLYTLTLASLQQLGTP